MCVGRGQYGAAVFNICRKLVGEDSQVLLSEKQDCAFAYVSKIAYKCIESDVLSSLSSLSLTLLPSLLSLPFSLFSFSLSLLPPSLSLSLSLSQVHYFSLNDIHARGFIRQLCFSYITSSPRYPHRSNYIWIRNHAKE